MPLKEFSVIQLFDFNSLQCFLIFKDLLHSKGRNLPLTCTFKTIFQFHYTKPHSECSVTLGATKNLVEKIGIVFLLQAVVEDPRAKGQGPTAKSSVTGEKFRNSPSLHIETCPLNQ